MREIGVGSWWPVFLSGMQATWPIFALICLGGVILSFVGVYLHSKTAQYEGIAKAEAFSSARWYGLIFGSMGAIGLLIPLLLSPPS